MRSNASDPNLYGIKGNKSFAAAKRSSVTRPADSYKLSSRMKSILSDDLKSHTVHGGCAAGDDSTIQSTNTRRRFQRRGSKCPSMFKTISSTHFDIPQSIFETIRKPISTGNNNMLIESAAGIQKGTEHSYLSSMTIEDFSDNTMDDSDEFAC